MRKYHIVLFLFISSIISITSCSKDDNNGPDVPEYTKPEITERQVVVEIPDQLQTLAEGGDTYAYMAIAYMGVANSIANFSNYFTIPSDVEPTATDNGNALYSWSEQGYSYWMTFGEENGKYTWTYEYEMPGYPRFTYIYAEEDKDGNSGSWTIYNPENPNEAVWIYNWSVDAQGIFTSTIQYDENANNDGVYEVVSNPDGGGSFTYRIEGSDQAIINWNADGSGDYWFYNEGEPVSESWNAS